MKKLLTTLRRAGEVILTMDVECYGEPALFAEPYDDEALSEATVEAMRYSGIPCEGSGTLAPWCRECPFGQVKNEDFEVTP